MKRLNKIALIPAAIAATLAGNAYAGTEACFEIYKGADVLAVSDFATVYGAASCDVSSTNATRNAALATNSAVSVAYELTKSLTVDLDLIDTVDKDQHIVYIPTTDIPGGTIITMELMGAVFDGNADQIHLVKDADGAGAGTDFEAVASSDGTLDGFKNTAGNGQVTFITKAGITIGAGTRLAFSRISTGTVSTGVDPVGFKIENTECTTTSSDKSVTLKAISAITDGGKGFDITGAKSKANVVADISAQFYPLHEGSTVEANVNAESTNASNTAIVARTEFVFDTTNLLKVQKTNAIYKTAFYNRGTAAVLDQSITLDADDHLTTKFIASAAPGATVKAGIYNVQDETATSGALTVNIPVQTGTQFGTFGLSSDVAGATAYNTEAVDLFTEVEGVANTEDNGHTGATDKLTGALLNEVFYTVTNTPATGVMNFNYDVSAYATLDFDTGVSSSTKLDHCEIKPKTHEVGVNGAVLKVPYVVNGEGNFVRVTNEHDKEAEVTFDIFGESDNGTTGKRKVTAVKLGKVAAQSSVVYFVPKLIEVATAAGYTGADGGYAAGSLGDDAANGASNDNRHTVTFTVTAPRDSVHGVSVQKIINGSDRVMPVLDQNEWSQ